MYSAEGRHEEWEMKVWETDFPQFFFMVQKIQAADVKQMLLYPIT